MSTRFPSSLAQSDSGVGIKRILSGVSEGWVLPPGSVDRIGG